ncbi:hypothetical protein GCM10010339_28520 [Streptomyces alanosinicus]|uniref:Uncharacterized protein n=1 Tax=Streptomyces alanosinicus TaxID=68171 RepID=A0A918YGD4_9ACTN|nr:hypothetical protein GCM10010339_28520 [Streptomyces alanosinicus]
MTPVPLEAFLRARFEEFEEEEQVARDAIAGATRPGCCANSRQCPCSPSRSPAVPGTTTPGVLRPERPETPEKYGRR